MISLNRSTRLKIRILIEALLKNWRVVLTRGIFVIHKFRASMLSHKSTENVLVLPPLKLQVTDKGAEGGYFIATAS